MSNPAKSRILVVDDDQYLAELFTMFFELGGYEVLTAGDGAQAVSILQNQSPDHAIDAITVDLMMPVMDGLRFMRWLRTEFKSTIPVLVLTGKRKEGIEELVMQAGANGILYKPVDLEEIIAKMASLLGRPPE